METIHGERCPWCGFYALDIYEDEETGIQHGTKCQACGHSGLYVRKRIVELVA